MTPKLPLIISVSALVLLTGCGSGSVVDATGKSTQNTEHTAQEIDFTDPAFAVTPVAAKAPAKGGMGPKEYKVLQLTNKARAKAGCKPLKANAKLTRAARKHSKDMKVKNYFSHDSKDGRSPWDRIKAEGYKYPGAENIAAGYPTAASVVKAWMNSKGHRANILNCKLKTLGVGHHKRYWTQDFGWK
ncbi:CAP domain-containing protein [Actinocorallia sp. API 0066]|uniref:CAP domain-containing protein n=1 Tax=Actinocorallia sp. API 0066 TaxID=2896846 RepID=UPI001E6231DC|nr:CAP domain-containing protein [Actinocorallia sp. API 0066]MCD0451915.1 CAP domain-containing protein [Actinocorallia sp. API 0066]